MRSKNIKKIMSILLASSILSNSVQIIPSATVLAADNSVININDENNEQKTFENKMQTAYREISGKQNWKYNEDDGNFVAGNIQLQIIKKLYPKIFDIYSYSLENLLKMSQEIQDLPHYYQNVNKIKVFLDLIKIQFGEESEESKFINWWFNNITISAGGIQLIILGAGESNNILAELKNIEDKKQEFLIKCQALKDKISNVSSCFMHTAIPFLLVSAKPSEKNLLKSFLFDFARTTALIIYKAHFVKNYQDYFYHNLGVWTGFLYRFLFK